MYGPRAWEGPTRRYGPMRRVAVVSDVHANVPALTAVLAEIEGAGVDLVVSCGDLTWGAEPDRTVELMAGLPRALFVRGNGERAVVDIHRGVRRPSTEREAWVPRQHSDASVAFVAGIPFSVVVDVVGLGPVRFCHGSPRGDTELVTAATPAERFAELAADVEEAVIVTGHTHLQFDRTVAGRRSVNPGSVGLSSTRARRAPPSGPCSARTSSCGRPRTTSTPPVPPGPHGRPRRRTHHRPAERPAHAGRDHLGRGGAGLPTRACPADHAADAGLGTPICGVVVTRRRSVSTPSSALQLHAPSPAHQPDPPDRP
ncbi:metallophosphoesterase family protein [Streptomyces mirabilis]|nr:metallophosphoesterase family protein [Streptomyces mirabilis]